MEDYGLNNLNSSSNNNDYSELGEPSALNSDNIYRRHMNQENEIRNRRRPSQMAERWRKSRLRNKLRLRGQQGSSFPGGLIRYNEQVEDNDLIIDDNGSEVLQPHITYDDEVKTKISVREVITLFVGLEELKHSAVYKASMIEFFGTMIFTYFSIAIVIASVNYYNFSNPFHDPPNPNLVQHPGVGILMGLGHLFLLLVLMIASGPGSGGILNPVVTLATITTGFTTLTKGVMYIIAQMVGALVGSAMMYASLPFEVYNRTHLGMCNYGNMMTSGMAIAAEYMMCTFLLYVIFGTALDPRQNEIFGTFLPLLFISITVGLTVFIPPGLLNFYGGPGYNLARCFGSAVISGHWKGYWVFVVAAILATITISFIIHVYPPFKYEKWKRKDPMNIEHTRN